MSTSMESATIASTVVGVKGPRQFQGLFDVIPFKFNLDEDSIAASATSTGDVAVPGAALGDFVLIAPTIDAVSLVVSGFVQSADTVTVVVQNTEVSDANTTFAGNPVFNGLVLKPKQNILAFGP